MRSKLGYFQVLLGFGLLIFILAVGSQPTGQAASPFQVNLSGDVLTVTLAAPAFTNDGQGGVKLIDQASLYSSDHAEGEPQLPHRLVRLALPPDADLTSLSMVVTNTTVEGVPGTFDIPLSGPKVEACAPLTAAPASCGGPFLQQSPAVNQFSILSLASSAQDASLLNSAFSAASHSAIKNLPTVTLLSPGQLRKWRFARLDFSPFQYDPASASLKVTRSITVTISFRRDPALLDPVLLADNVLDEEAQTSFDNFDQAKGDYASAAAQGPAFSLSSASDYVIISTDEIYANSDLGQFILFLKEHGHTVTGIHTSSIQSSILGDYSLAEKIRMYLQNIYAAWGIKYLLLVGNPDPNVGDVPMMKMYPEKVNNPGLDTNYWENYVPTDSYYSNLTGNWDLNGDGFPGEANGDIGPGGVDFTPTVFVGRIPVYDADYGALNKILHKTMDFEEIGPRQPWQDQALLPMTFWGHGYDAMTLGYLLNPILNYHGITAYRMAMDYNTYDSYDYCIQDSSYPFDHNMLYDAVANRWANHPVGLMVWSGHGNFNDTLLGWGDAANDCWRGLGYLFLSSEASWLNDSQPAFTFHNSCLNGQPEHADNIGYSVLWNGAVASVSASRNTWLDESGDSEANLPYNYTSGSGIAYHYTGFLLEGYSASEALGWTLAHSTLGYDWDLQNLFAFNVYGDPSVVYMVPSINAAPDAPSNLEVSRIINSDQTQFDLSWKDNGYWEEFFRVTLANWDSTVYLTQDLGRNAIAAHIPNLPCSRTFYITVQAVNGAFLSDPSNMVPMATAPCYPSAPTGLSATIINHKVTLNWTKNLADVLDGFHIYRRLKVGSYYLPPVLAGTVNGFTTTFVDNGAGCLENLSYTVTAFNATGESNNSAAAAIVVPSCVPPAPTNFVAAPTQTSITFTWSDNSTGFEDQESGFEIMFYEALGGPYTLVILPPDTTSYTLANQTCYAGELYNYEVVAFNSGGSSTSNLTGFIATLPCTTPDPPTNLTVSSSNLDPHSLHLGWDDNSNNEYGFAIEKRVGGGSWSPAAAVATNVTEATITGLACSTSYDFRVKAFNDLSSPWDEVDGTSTGVCDVYAPTDFQVDVISAGQVDLSWGPPTTPSLYLTGYELVYVKSFGRLISFETITTVPKTRLDYHDFSVSCGKSYRYSIRALYDTLHQPNSSYIAPVTVKTPPCPPVNLAVFTVSQSELDISWQTPSGNAPTGYFLERSPAGQNAFERVFEAVHAELVYADTGLTCGTSYDYRAQSNNADGVGPFGPVVTGATVVCEPAAPSGLTVDHISKTGLTLHWVDNSNNEDGFRIERTTSPLLRGSWTEVGTVGQGVTSFADSKLDCGTDYYYRVLSYNAGGDSSPSPMLATGTLPCSLAFQAEAFTAGSVKLTWRDPGKNTNHYDLERSSNGTIWSPLATVPAGVVSYFDRTAPCGGTLWYQITATNAFGSTLTTPPAQEMVVCKPTTELGLRANFASSTQVHLIWKVISGGGHTSFVVARSPNGQDGFVDIATLPAAASSFDDQGLPPWSVYYYQVRAVNTGGSTSSNMARPWQYILSLPMVRRN